MEHSIPAFSHETTLTPLPRQCGRIGGNWPGNRCLRFDWLNWSLVVTSKGGVDLEFEDGFAGLCFGHPHSHEQGVKQYRDADRPSFQVNVAKRAK